MLKFKKSLVWLLVLCLALVCVPFAAMASEGSDASALAEYVVLPDGMDESAFGTHTVTDGVNFYATLQEATQAIADAGTDGAVLYCKPDSDVGSLQHAPVVKTLTVYGNGAYVSGGAERDFDIGNTDPSGGKDITSDVTLTVKYLDGCGAWGAKATDHTVNLVFENCSNMGKVFITGTTGVLNIKMNDCAFEGVIKEAVYSNANGTIELTKVDFSNLNKAINLNHKVAGEQKIVLTDCSFTNCGNDVSADQIPVRVLSSVEGGSTALTVSGCAFSGTPEGGADILLDYGVGTATADVSGTAAHVAVEFEENVATKKEIASDQSVSTSNIVYVANINGVDYKTFADALAAASAMTGDVTIEIFDKVTLNQAFSGSYDSIKFVGKDTDAEIYLDVQGYITASGKKVAFEDLKLSKVAGGYITNAGFMNLAFGVYSVDKVTYTDCTFVNGACASSGEVIFDGCTFYRSHDRYGLWVYGAADVTVSDSVFPDIRGIKLFAEGNLKVTDLTVKNTDFSAVDGKPAIVLTSGKSVTLEGNTYNSAMGVFELDLDGVPNGTRVTSDVPPTCVNDNGACGVLVDGKIYTTVAQAAEVATAGSTVTLLHNSAETVEFDKGVSLDKNGFAAAGVTVVILDGTGTEADPYIIDSREALIAFRDAVNSGNSYDDKYIKLTADIDLAGAAWAPIGTSSAPFKGIFDGNGKTVSNLVVNGGKNQGFFGYADQVTIKDLTLNNVTVTGTDCVGAIAGQVYSVSLINNCHVTGNIRITGQTNVGGITGKYYAKVQNCSVIGDGAATSFIKGVYYASDFEGDNVGGIMGHCGENNALIGNTVKNITISGTRKVGGIVGIADQDTDVQGCVVENVVIETTATADYANSKLSSMSIGGLIGQYQAAGSQNDGTVKGCFVKGVAFNNVNSVTVDIGPIVGGARGGSNAMLAPSAQIAVATNQIYLTTITGASNEYLVVYVAQLGEAKYATLTEALDAAEAGATILILADLTEEISELTDVKLATNVAGGVTITNTYTGWTSLTNVMIGNGVTFVTKNALFDDAGVNVIKGTVHTTAGGTFYNAYDSKTTIQNGGNVIADGMIVNRYHYNADSGIYVYGDGDDSTVEIYSADTIGTYSGIFYAKDATIEGKMLWIDYKKDSSEEADKYHQSLVYFEDSTVSITKEFRLYKDASLKLEGASVTAGKVQIRQDATPTINVDGDSTIKAASVENLTGALMNAVLGTDGTVSFVNMVAKIGTTYYATIQAAIAAAQNGDTVTILAGEYAPFNISNKNITIQGTVGSDGELLTTIKGGNPAITGHGFNGTIKDLKIVDAWKVMYAEPAGNVTIDNVYVTGATYGFHLVAYSEGLTWTIQNSYMDLRWANSFGVYGSGDAAIVITGNIFEATNPYYEGGDVLHVNSFLPNITVTENVFGENAKIRMEVTDTSNINISKNYHADGVDNAFSDDSDVAPIILEYYKDETLTELVKRVAKIGDVDYATLEEALAAIQAGETLTLLADVTLTETLTLPAGIILNGNGKQINGEVWAGGDLTFVGHTKVTNFNAGYEKPTITIGAGACLELTGAGRMVIGHGATFNITGTIADAKTANVADLTPSLIMPGASFTGAGVTFNVTNAYIKAPASYCSSSKSASGTFDFNITNSIWESAGKLAFESQSTAATVNFDLKDSVLTTGSHLVFGVSRGEIVIDNSNVNVGTSNQLENQSTMIIKNGSVVNGSVVSSSNGKNPGTIIVENATYAVTGEFTGSDLGTGTIIVKNGAIVSAGSITKSNIVIDATGMAAGDIINLTANLTNLTGTVSVINNDKLEAEIVGGKIVLSAKPVAKIGETYYKTLQAAIDAAQTGDVIVIIGDIELVAQNAQELFKPAYNRESYCGVYIPDDKQIAIDLNGHTISYVDAYGDVDNVMILNLGHLTIKDSATDGKITYKPVAGTSTYSKFYSTIFNCGTLIINGGVIENTCETETDVSNAVDNHSRLSHEYGNDCILEVNGGSLIGAYYYAVRQYTHYLEGVENRVTINDGTIYGGIYMQHGDSWYYADASKNRLNVDCFLTINGGTITKNLTPDEFGKIKSRLSNPDNNSFGLEINGGIIEVPVELLVQRGYYYENGVSGALAPTEAAGARNDEWLTKNGGFITGGTFTDPGVAGSTTDLSKFLIKGKALEANTDGTYGVENRKVASVNGVKYETLREAVDAVADGGTIVLLGDIIIDANTRELNSGTWYDGIYIKGDKSFTLDLAGYTITQDGSVNDYLINFINQGDKANTVTIKNGTIDAANSAFCALCTSASSTQKITINLEGVKLINNVSNGSTAKIRGGAELNVKAGTVITGKNSYLAIECVASTVNIYDGAELYMNGTGSYNGCLVGVCYGGVVNVYGGYGKGVKGGFIAMTSGGTINVYGGEWIANTDGSIGDNSNLYVLTAQNNADESGYVGASIINVYGGILRGGVDAWILNQGRGEVAELNIFGGNFNANPGSYVESEYVAVQKSDSTYDVVKAAAKVGTTYYATIQAAIDAAQSGDVITLLVDLVLNDVLNIEKAITLDLNGKTVTGADGAIVFNIKAATTIKNGTILGNKSGTSSGLIDIYADLTMDGVTVETSKILALRFKVGGMTATLENCNVTGAFKGYGASVWVIKSGTYKASSTSISEQLNGTASISGGTFFYEIKEENCAPGYAVVDNGDGSYGVKYAPVGFVDANNNGALDEGEVIFGSLEAIFNTYKTGDVYIVLTADAVINNQVDTTANAKYYLNTNVAEGVTVEFAFADDWNYVQKMYIGENVTVKAPYLLAWTELEVYGNIETTYLYITTANVLIAEGAVVNANTGEATVQVKNGATLTVNGTLNTAILNVWAGESKLVVSGANAKVNASWIDIWDGAPSVAVESGATLEVDKIKVSRGGEIEVNNATLTAEKIEIGHNGESAGVLTESGNSTINGAITLTATGSTVSSDGGLNVTTDIADHKVIFENGEYKVVAKVYVAQVGDAKFESLAEALAEAAKTDDLTVIELVADELELGRVKFPAKLKNVIIKGAEGKQTIVKNSLFYSADGNSVVYEGITFDGIVFDNTQIVFTGARNGEVIYKDWTITNCEFKNIVSTANAAVHFNLASDETIENFTFTNNVINGVTGGSVSGLRLNYVSGNVTITGNDISNVAWNAIQIVNSRVDTFVVENNTLASENSSILNIYNVTTDDITIKNNKFMVQEGQRAIANLASADVSENYWGGNAPAGLPEGVTANSYYADAAMTQLIEAVAMIGDKVYYSLADALNAAVAGDTVKLIADATYDGILMLKGITLDLDGKTLIADGVIALKSASIVDTNETAKGLLKVADKDMFVMSKADYPMLPVWNEEGNGFFFVNVKVQAELEQVRDDSFKVIYRPSINGAGIVNKDIFGDGALDNDLVMKINILCIKEGAVAETLGFVLSDDLIAEIYSAETTQAVYLTLFGATDMFDAYQIEFVIESASGISFSEIFADAFTPVSE